MIDSANQATCDIEVNAHSPAPAALAAFAGTALSLGQAKWSDIENGEFGAHTGGAHTGENLAKEQEQFVPVTAGDVFARFDADSKESNNSKVNKQILAIGKLISDLQCEPVSTQFKEWLNRHAIVLQDHTSANCDLELASSEVCRLSVSDQLINSHLATLLMQLSVDISP